MTGRFKDQAELKIYADELARRLSEGQSIQKIARDFRWAQADVREFLKDETFQERMRELDEELLITILQDSVEDLSAAEAGKFISARTKDYIELLDELARSATSEQVRLTALLNLINKSPIAGDMKSTDTVSIEEADITRFTKAIAEIMKLQGGSE